MLELRRLTEGICVKDDMGLRLLCDDARSLMQMLYGTHLVIFKSIGMPLLISFHHLLPLRLPSKIRGIKSSPESQ